MHNFFNHHNDDNEAMSEFEVLALSHEIAAALTREFAKIKGLDYLLSQLHALNIPPFRAQSDKSEEDTIAYCLITSGQAMIYVCEFEPALNEVYGYIVNTLDEEPNWGCWDLEWMMDNVGIWIDDDFTPQPLGPTIRFWEEVVR